MGEYGKEVATKGINNKSSQQVEEEAGSRSEVEHTSKSLEPACMYLSMKSKMVSQRAAKVESDSSGDRCCRKTCDPPSTFSHGYGRGLPYPSPRLGGKPVLSCMVILD